MLDEFDVTEPIVLGGGDGYQRAEALALAEVRMAVPVNFPKGTTCRTPFGPTHRVERAQALGVGPVQRRPAARRSACGVHRARVEGPICFLGNVRKAVDAGLSETEALRALTSTPASWLGLRTNWGSLKQGRVANVLVTDGPLFAQGTHIVEHWVAGQATPMRDRHPLDLSGSYNVNVDDSVYVLSVQGEPGKWKASWTVNDSTEVKVPLTLDNRTVVLRLATEDGPIRLTGNVWMESRIWEGSGQTATGQWTDWSAIRNADEDPAPDTQEDEAEASDVAQVRNRKSLT